MLNFDHKLKPSADWRESLQFIKSLRQELDESRDLLTPYGFALISREIKRQQEAVYPAVVAGLITAHHTAIRRYEDATAQIAKARTAEINRWKPELLRAELDNAAVLIRLAIEERGPSFALENHAERLRAIYGDAKQSGDMYKQRAACEVLQSLNIDAFTGDTRLAAFSLKEQAARDLSALRETPEIVKAKQDRESTVNELFDCGQQIAEASETLGQGSVFSPFASGPLAQAVRRVKVNRQTGEVLILAEDAPEVTGVGEIT